MDAKKTFEISPRDNVIMLNSIFFNIYTVGFFLKK